MSSIVEYADSRMVFERVSKPAARTQFVADSGLSGATGAGIFRATACGESGSSKRGTVRAGADGGAVTKRERQWQWHPQWQKQQIPAQLQGSP